MLNLGASGATISASPAERPIHQVIPPLPPCLAALQVAWPIAARSTSTHEKIRYLHVDPARRRGFGSWRNENPRGPFSECDARAGVGGAQPFATRQRLVRRE